MTQGSWRKAMRLGASILFALAAAAGALHVHAYAGSGELRAAVDEAERAARKPVPLLPMRTKEGVPGVRLTAMRSVTARMGWTERLPLDPERVSSAMRPVEGALDDIEAILEMRETVIDREDGAPALAHNHVVCLTALAAEAGHDRASATRLLLDALGLAATATHHQRNAEAYGLLGGVAQTMVREWPNLDAAMIRAVLPRLEVATVTDSPQRILVVKTLLQNRTRVGASTIFDDFPALWLRGERLVDFDARWQRAAKDGARAAHELRPVDCAPFASLHGFAASECDELTTIAKGLTAFAELKKVALTAP